MSRVFVLLLALLPTSALAQSSAVDLQWRPSLTPSERADLLERPRFAVGEPMMVGGLVAAGAGIAMFVSGLATKTPELTTAGAIAWPIGASIHFVGLGLFVSETKPYFRDLADRPAHGLTAP